MTSTASPTGGTLGSWVELQKGLEAAVLPYNREITSERQRSSRTQDPSVQAQVDE